MGGAGCLDLGFGATERGPMKAWDCCVLHGVGCLPVSQAAPMATSPFSVPYLTVSAESKLFTLFLSRGVLCLSWTAHLWDISLCPTSCGQGHNQAGGASCLAHSPGLTATRGTLFAPLILLACFQETIMEKCSCEQLSEGLDLTDPQGQEEDLAVLSCPVLGEQPSHPPSHPPSPCGTR